MCCHSFEAVCLVLTSSKGNVIYSYLSNILIHGRKIELKESVVFFMTVCEMATLLIHIHEWVLV